MRVCVFEQINAISHILVHARRRGQYLHTHQCILLSHFPAVIAVRIIFIWLRVQKVDPADLISKQFVRTSPLRNTPRPVLTSYRALWEVRAILRRPSVGPSVCLVRAEHVL